MKIIYISSSVIPSRAANSIHVMKVCQAFSDLDYEVTLLAPNAKQNYEQGVADIYEYYGVKNVFNVIKMPWLTWLKGKVFLYSFLSALKAKTESADLVFCRDFYGAVFASLLGKKVVYESHTPIGSSDSGSLNVKAFKKLIINNNFVSLVVITHSLKEYYLEHYPSLAGKIIVAADGADPVSEDVVPVKFEHSGHRMQVGYVGHLYPGRGVDVIIELASLCKWADFHIIGGAEKDIAYWRDIVGDASNIIFHGFVTPREAERMRIGCDVLLAPYQQSVAVAGGSGNTVQWMSPLKVFEYMAAGKAILCADLEVLHEVLEHDRNALLCEAANAEDWAEKLTLIKDNQQKMTELGHNALSDFSAHYSWYSRVDNIMKAIRRI